MAASAATSLVAGPVWSHFADTRLGTSRALVVSSLTTTAAALALMASGMNVWAILGAVLLLGAAQSPGAPLSDSLALGTLGGAQETEYGRIRLWTSVGWAVASIGFGAWFEHEGLGSLLPLYATSTLAFATQAAWTFVPLVIATGGGGPFLVGVSAGIAAVIEVPVFAAGGALGVASPSGRST